MHRATAHHLLTNAQPVPKLSPSLMCSAWCHMVWNVPWVSWDRLSWLCPLTTSSASPVHSLAGSCEKLSVSPAQPQPKHQCVLSTLFLPQIQNTALYQLLGRKFTPSQLKPGDWGSLALLPKKRSLLPFWQKKPRKAK